MRKIKFRAWHKIANCMCQNVKTDLLDRDYLEFMQYTGVKDCDDVEIYEGDIVEITWANGKTKRRYKVFYFEEGAFFQLDNLEDKDDFDTFCGYSQSQLKVLGNIYQNPELLEIK